MAQHGWNTQVTRVTIPVSGGTVNSTPITVPKGAIAVTIEVPTLAGGATYKIQSLRPTVDVNQLAAASETWTDLYVWDETAAVERAVATLTSNRALTFSIRTVGGGVLRLVASSDQSAVPITGYVSFHFE